MKSLPVLTVTSLGYSRTPSRRIGSRGTPQPALHLGADRKILDILAQGLRQESVQLVASIVADFFPKQTGAYPKPDLLHDLHYPFRYPDKRLIQCRGDLANCAGELFSVKSSPRCS